MVWTNFGYYYEKNEDVGCGYRNVVEGSTGTVLRVVYIMKYKEDNLQITSS